MIRSQQDIPSRFKGIRLPVEQDGARLAMTRHARLRYWQRLGTDVTDQHIIEHAARALREGDPRFRFRARIFDNPHRPTVVVLITVLSDEMNLPAFAVDFTFERDDKWHEYLERMNLELTPRYG